MQVKEYRIKKGYTQQQVADLLNIGVKAYGHKERGIRGFDVEELLALEIILEASISDMFKTVKEDIKLKINKWNKGGKIYASKLK